LKVENKENESNNTHIYLKVAGFKRLRLRNRTPN
jgi:hypothetical protein